MSEADELHRLFVAWSRWDAFPSHRDRVIDLQNAMRPIAARLGVTTITLTDTIIAATKSGLSLREAITKICQFDK